MHLRLEVHLFSYSFSLPFSICFSSLQTQADTSSARAYHDDATFKNKKTRRKAKKVEWVSEKMIIFAVTTIVR